MMRNDSGRTWLTFSHSSLQLLSFDELHLLNGAHLALEPVDVAGTKHELFVQTLIGENFVKTTSNMGTLHVGQNQEMTIRQTNLYMPAHIRVYENGLMTLPSTTKWIGAKNIVNGTIGGLSDVTLVHTDFYLAETSKTYGMTQAATYTFSSLTLMAESTIHLTSNMTTYSLAPATLYMAATSQIRGYRVSLECTTMETEEGAKVDVAASLNMNTGTGFPGLYFVYRE